MTTIVARLNDRAQPMDRGDLYEDPLDAILKERGLGEVTGGGTQLGKNNEIEFCDLEIEMNDPSTLPLIISELESLGAPKGSRLILNDDSEEIGFGINDGLGVYLNGSDLPPSTYEDCDVNFVYSEFERLLGDAGSIHSHWQGPTETALYLYGPSFSEMTRLLTDFIASYPLCAQARLVQIA
jgi:hypothetical protein